MPPRVEAKPAAPVERTEPTTRAQVRDEIKRLSERLRKLDAEKHSGARPRGPVARMLDARALEKDDPDHHYCYVNTDMPGNVQGFMDDGYQAVDEETCRKAGVRQKVGEVVLMKVPRERFEDHVEDARDLARSRLEAHRQEFRAEVESVVRELRDRGLTDHDIRRILVDE